LLFAASPEHKNAERHIADGTVQPPGDVNIATLAPPDIRLGKFTTKAGLLRSELIRMCRYVLGAFGADDRGLTQLIAEDLV
jgi:hypothetical protein